MNFDKKSSRYSLHDFLKNFAISRMTPQEKDDNFLAYSQYYFEILASADDRFEQGGENILKGLTLFRFRMATHCLRTSLGISKYRKI